MEECPSKELLNKFIDEDLNEEMNEQIFAHLEICDNCLWQVVCLLSEEKGLITSLLASPIRQKILKPVSSQRCPSKPLLLAYAGKALLDNDEKLVETHLEQCDHCLRELIRLQTLMVSRMNLDLDLPLPKEKTSLLSPDFSPLEIILRIKNNFIELLKQTGELITPVPQLGLVRGEMKSQDNPIIIRKDLKKRDLSIEVKIKPKLIKSSGTIGISLLRISDEEFLSERDVSLVGKEGSLKARTNKEGFVEFSDLKPESFKIVVEGEDTVFLSIE